jgi:hypothetical protein
MTTNDANHKTSKRYTAALIKELHELVGRMPYKHYNLTLDELVCQIQRGKPYDMALNARICAVLCRLAMTKYEYIPVAITHGFEHGTRERLAIALRLLAVVTVLSGEG